MFSHYIFYFLSIMALFSAVMMLVSKKPIHSVLFLTLTFFAIAGHYILLNAQFLAVVHVIVYTGAIMVLFLFVIMLLDIREEERRKLNGAAVGIGAIAVGTIAGILTRSLWHAQPLAKVATAEGATRPLGRILFTQYLLPFEVLSILLLVAMVGVILLSRKELKET